jgi:hypothetical protein
MLEDCNLNNPTSIHGVARRYVPDEIQHHRGNCNREIRFGTAGGKMNSVPRHLKIGLILIAIAGIVSGGYFVGVVGRIRNMVREPDTEANPFVAPTAPLYSSADPAMDVKIFFRRVPATRSCRQSLELFSNPVR